MSLTLKTAISATQTTIDVLGSDALNEGDIRQIDSEQLMVRTANAPARGYLETAYQRLTVFRGVAGTSKASHSANASLSTPSGGGGGVSVTDGLTTVAASSIQMPSGTVSDLGGGAAAVALILQQIGPFTVHYNDADIKGDAAPSTGKSLASLVTGTRVIYAWAEVTSNWVFPGAGSLNIAVAPVSDLTDWQAITSYDGGNPHQVAAGGDASVILEAADNSSYGGRPLHLAARPTEAARLVCVTLGSPTAGVADIY